MTTSSSKAVDKLVAKLSQPHREIVAALRKVIKVAVPGIEERIAWGMPCYFLDGMVCTILPYKTHVNLQLNKGVKLADPRHLLEGTGKGMRHLKVRAAGEIPVAQVKRWIREILALNAPPRSGNTSSKRPRG